MESYTSTTFTDLLRIIGKKPGFYLTPGPSGYSQSISHLSTFICGYQAGQTNKGNTEVLGEFDFWVCHHYWNSGGSRRWWGLILERTDGDEAAAFRLFFEHFEEYLKERETIGPAAIKARFMGMLDQMHSDKDEAT